MKITFFASFLIIQTTLECSAQQNLQPQQWSDSSGVAHQHSKAPTRKQDPSITHGSSMGIRKRDLADLRPIEEAANGSAMDLGSGLRKFALDMLLDLVAAAPGKNVVFSPFSVAAAMLVVYEGAEGETARQIANALKFIDNKSKVRRTYKRLVHGLQRANNMSSLEFFSGNAMIYNELRPPLPDFERFVLNDYKFALKPVNPLAAGKIINDWAAEVTHNRTRMIVKPEDLIYPQLVITSALHFRTLWKFSFDPSGTRTREFFDERNQRVAYVRMMHQNGFFMNLFVPEINAHVLDLPCEDSQFRMLVVLPAPSSSVADVLRRMKRFPVDRCYERLVQRQEEDADEDERRVLVCLPRFKFGSQVELKPSLQRLGVTDAFDSARADLSVMSELRQIVSNVLHAADVEVTEEGNVASAATASVSNKFNPPIFRANRPFAYFIVENSQKTVIFAGKVADPTKSSY